jgi:drug/metabolite transporter (DMT)-like permease
VAFSGVLLMIAGGSSTQEHKDAPGYAYALMLLAPFLISIGELAMRMMMKMPETIVSLYVNFTMLIT